MNTVFIIVVSLISILLLIIGISFLLIIKKYNPHTCDLKKHDTSIYPGTIEYHNEEGHVPYLLKRKEDGSISDDPFKIMVVADMHNSTSECEFTLTILSRFIEKEQPDLVIMLGDNFTSHTDEEYQKRLIKFFENRKLYYGFVLGNHDSEAKVSNEIRRLEKYKTLSQEEKNVIIKKGRKWAFDTTADSKYCVSYDALSGILHGSGNSVVNIKTNKGISQSIFFFDSGDYIWDRKRKDIGTEKRCYDYIREDQLNWYLDKLEESKLENNNVVPKSSCFFHIPLREFEKAWNEVKFNTGKAKLLYGANFEKASSSDIDDGVFDTFKNSNSAQLLVAGHDHKNDSLIEYQGVKLMFSQGLQYDGAYNRRKRAPLAFKILDKIGGKYSIYNEGVSIIQVKNNGELDIYARYALKEHFFDGLENYYDKAFFRNFNKNAKGKSYVSTDIVNYIGKNKFTEIDLGKYKKFNNAHFKFNAFKYEVKNFGYMFILESKSIFNKENISSLIFTPSSGIDVPLLIVNLERSKKKNIAYIEYFDLTKNKLGHVDFKKIKDKYDDIPDYIDDSNWYIKERTPYSIIKGGINATKAQIDTMAINVIKNYILIAQESTINKENLTELNNFKERMIKEGIPKTIKYVLNNKAEFFFDKYMMDLEMKDE